MKKMVIISTILLLSSVTVAYGYYNNNEDSTFKVEQNELPLSNKVMLNKEIGDRIAEAPVQLKEIEMEVEKEEVEPQQKEEKVTEAKTEIEEPVVVNDLTKEEKENERIEEPKTKQIQEDIKEENTSAPSTSQDLSYILNHVKANQTKEEVINILGSDYKVKQDHTGHSTVPHYWLYEIGAEPGYDFQGKYEDELDVEGLVSGRVKRIVTVFFDKNENGQEVVRLANVYVKDGESVKEIKIMDE